MTAGMAKALEIQTKLTDARFDDWTRNDLFHLRWWIILALFVADVFIWWKITDKSRLHEIILFAAVAAVMILALDEIGEELTLWDYPTDIAPLFPPVTAIDLACLPFLYALIYQFFKKWKWYIIASLIMSAFSCFVFEPLFVWAGMYQMISWKSYYGFPLYFAIGIISKAVLSAVKAIEKKKTNLKYG